MKYKIDRKWKWLWGCMLGAAWISSVFFRYLQIVVVYSGNCLFISLQNAFPVEVTTLPY